MARIKAGTLPKIDGDIDGGMLDGGDNTQTATVTETATIAQTLVETTTVTNTETVTMSSVATLTVTTTATLTGTATSSSTATQSGTTTSSGSKTQTGTVTRTATALQTATRTVMATQTVTATQTLTSTALQTGTTSRTATATQTSTALLNYQQLYVLTGTITSTNTATVYYASWAHTKGNTATATTASYVIATASKSVTATVTSTFNGTETKTVTATVRGSGVSSGTTTVTVTATRTSAAVNAGGGGKTITATGTATNTATQSWTYHPTVTVTQTLTGTGTMVGTTTRTVTNTRTATTIATATTSSTVTQTTTPTVTNTVTFTGTTPTTLTLTNTGTVTASTTSTATKTVSQGQTTTSTNTVTGTTTRSATVTTTVTNTGTNTGGAGNVVLESIPAFWRCNQEGYSCPDWTGAVINWPSWAAYQSNARQGYNSRSVYDADGNPLYPYMGSWANGCIVTVESGVALIVEWQRGTDTWRPTLLNPGETHQINLVSPEDGAMIETPDDSVEPFTVSLQNCNPQPLSTGGTGTGGASGSGGQSGSGGSGTPGSFTSQIATWTCTGAPCPWGSSTSGNAAVWPSSAGALSARLGYTVSAGVYLPALSANGAVITLGTGTATVYAGLPDAESHRVLSSLTPGQPYAISGLGAGEVASVQSSSGFTYDLTLPADPGQSSGGQSGSGGSAGSGGTSDTGGASGSGGQSGSGGSGTPGLFSSQAVTWTCTGAPCPWGSSESGEAAVWPSSAGALSARLGYTVSAGIYLPAVSANGAVVTLGTGTATVYAGLPDAQSHRVLSALTPGQPHTISGLGAGEVASMQSSSAFTYDLTLPADPGQSSGGQSGSGGSPGSGGISDTGGASGSGGQSGSGGAGTPGLFSSQAVTWTCTGAPCPWGSSDSGEAAVWPSSAGALAVRLGYTVSAGIYLPAVSANGAVVTLGTGTATVYAGLPDAQSHRVLSPLTAGQPYTISGLGAGEVASVQSSSSFSYDLTLPADPGQSSGGQSGGGGSPGSGGTSDTGGASGPGGQSGSGGSGTPDSFSSQIVTWTCTGAPCPWGSSTSGEAAVWPPSVGALAVRLGYTVSAGIYLPAVSANGTVVTLGTGTATVYAGLPDAQSHRVLSALTAGQPYTISGLGAGEVASVQSGSSFTYELILSVDPG